MDHAIEGLRKYYEITLEHLYDEWLTGKYNKLFSCPSYREAITYKKAIRVLQGFSHEEYDEFTLEDVQEDIKTSIYLRRGILINWSE